MTNRFKISLPIEKRMILHLAEYQRYKDQIEVDVAVTQRGISNAIGIRLEHVSRAVKNLISRNYIYTRRAYIKTDNRHKKAYFLTNKGIYYAKEIRRWLDNKSIFIRTFEHEIREIKFNQLNNFIKFKLKPLEAYRYSLVSGEGVIDLNQVLLDKKQDVRNN